MIKDFFIHQCQQAGSWSLAQKLFKKKKPFSYTIILVPLHLPFMIFIPFQGALFSLATLFQALTSIYKLILSGGKTKTKAAENIREFLFPILI
ncbi:hypothetical protein C6H88_00060 [Chlamydia muridarum str. Nigg]|nr:hypothetical protein [Chlamydia muridarum]AHH23312.1 hypothetical protein TAC_00060 [Chlamydia muridarum str. Nigg3 CMUT3-5]AHH24239.1 hypothetical protein Y015_00060 [Chlamydia muridarum str. Nigg CM972]AID37564.1 hypothetical protein BB17_00065 [Chlamydia muridarum str. Nigg 2 MCR]AVM87825.1 hypothetical protein C6H96_00060 [Chlamydia muridarum str. Nigg]UFU86866.1 hypothetical protein FTN28_00060 [Chlamydia trachomatis]